MAIYRGATKVAGIVKGFRPENTGTEGQVLTKTNTGYNWQGVQGGEELPYLCFTAETAGSTVQLTQTGSPTAVSLETSTDGNTWADYTIGDTITLANAGDKVYWRNKSETDTGFSLALNNNYYRFAMTGYISGSGDIGYLLNKNSTDTLSNYCFTRLFQNCSSLIKAPDLPATTLAEYCYGTLFNNCINLISVPEVLPATTLAANCYRNMFFGCSSLTKAPILPATTLAANCYNSMFQSSGLNIPPQLPATTLADACYSAMFAYCPNLMFLPNLPAISLTNYCYYNMFIGCSNIKLSTTQTGIYQKSYRIPTSGTGTTAANALSSMFAYTGGTSTSDPTVNTTYYISNQVI